jgi:hypothetical protein
MRIADRVKCSAIALLLAALLITAAWRPRSGPLPLGDLVQMRFDPATQCVAQSALLDACSANCEALESQLDQCLERA